MRRNTWSTILAVLAILVLILPVSAHRDSADFPDLINLPVGFRPEGIAVGRGATFYTGSLADGRVLRGDLRTGETEELVPGAPGAVSVGMAYDRRHNALFVAGGPTGMARVFDASSGELLAAYQLAPAGNFINDVIVTRGAAYFTVSSLPVFYKIPFLRGHGDDDEDDDDASSDAVNTSDKDDDDRPFLPAQDAVVEIPLTGDWQQIPNAFNANGIEATRDGRWLIIVNSNVGDLFRVDPRTGQASLIRLGQPGLVTNGDGLLLRGGLLYVVRNQLNEIVAIDLDRKLETGEIVGTLTNPNFNVPTTIAAFGDALYAVNAKFGSPTPEAIPYEVVRVPLD